MPRMADESSRAAVYSPGVSRAFIAFVVVVVMGAVLFVASVVENHGCMPWQTAVQTGGSVFSENDRQRTVCR